MTVLQLILYQSTIISLFKGPCLQRETTFIHVHVICFLQRTNFHKLTLNEIISQKAGLSVFEDKMSRC